MGRRKDGVGDGKHIVDAMLARTQSSTALSDERLSALVDQLERVKNARTLQLAHEIGELVASHLYGGDPEGYRRRGTQDATYRRLVRHPRLSLSPVTVWRALGVYELCCRVPDLLECNRLKSGHVYAVLRLPHQQQEQLLQAAAEEQWSVNQIEAEAAAHSVPNCRGRPRHTPLRRAVDALRKFLEMDVHGPVELGSSKRQRAEAVELVRRARRRCDELERMLGD